jgi:hypothetical protein
MWNSIRKKGKFMLPLSSFLHTWSSRGNVGTAHHPQDVKKASSKTSDLPFGESLQAHRGGCLIDGNDDDGWVDRSFICAVIG